MDIEKLINKLSRCPTEDNANAILTKISAYGESLPHRFPQFTGTQDTTAEEILRLTQAQVLTRYNPLKVDSDGNCAYRAVSLGLFGDEKYHLYIRLVAGIEMILFRHIYDTKDPMYEIIISNYIIISSYDNLLSDILRIGGWAETMHLYAISAAINLPISTFYPPVNGNLLMENPYTMKIYGRGVRKQTPSKLVLMWSSCSEIYNLNDIFNHFALLKPILSAQPPFEDVKINKDNIFNDKNNNSFIIDESTQDISYEIIENNFVDFDLSLPINNIKNLSFNNSSDLSVNLNYNLGDLDIDLESTLSIPINDKKNVSFNNSSDLSVNDNYNLGDLDSTLSLPHNDIKNDTFVVNENNNDMSCVDSDSDITLSIPFNNINTISYADEHELERSLVGMGEFYLADEFKKPKALNDSCLHVAKSGNTKYY
ncbi:uncharacterized protein LOC135926891 [Gordionus sp. m RMFG-2023]|uniref:uncharacterized protein LOC135926891 n=1 Tax=Gordionus sp. m RMFG-2023 TaxID=3053472 RepID=UPI0031FDECC0